jgi:hypothetical protein
MKIRMQCQRASVLRRLSQAALVLSLIGPAAAQEEAQAQAVAVSTPVPTVEQVYRPANMRDPLKVATMFGDEHAPSARAAVSDLARSTFSIYSLALTGIMEDSRSKEAMLVDNSTGEIYLLKGGRLLDSKKKQMPGISGVIKGKQVILMTEDKKVHQLNLHETD